MPSTTESGLAAKKNRTASSNIRLFTRRRFFKYGTTIAAFTAVSWSRVFGANERVGIGVIGCGLIGRIHTRNFAAQKNAQIIGVSDTYRPRMDADEEWAGG